MWRSRGSSLGLSWRTELLPLSTRKSPATLEKIRFDCLDQWSCSFNYYSKFLTKGEGRIEDWPTGRENFALQFSPQYCGSCTNPSINFTLHSSLTLEQNPKYFNSSTWGRASPSPQREQSTLFQLRARCWSSHGSLSAVEHSNQSWRSLDHSNRTTYVNRSDGILRQTNRTRSVPWPHPEFLAIKAMNRISSNTQPWQSLTPTLKDY